MKPVKSVLLALLLVLGLGACSVATRMGMRPATVPVFLVLGGELYTGEAQGFNDRRASITLHTDTGDATTTAAPSAPPGAAAPSPAAAPAAAPLTCAGTLAFTAERYGNIELSCSNGQQPRLGFESTGWATGFAYSATGVEPAASLTFGFPPESAGSYLRAPSGKKLVVTPPDSLKLE